MKRKLNHWPSRTMAAVVVAISTEHHFQPFYLLDAFALAHSTNTCPYTNFHFNLVNVSKELFIGGNSSEIVMITFGTSSCSSSTKMKEEKK